MEKNIAQCAFSWKKHSFDCNTKLWLYRIGALPFFFLCEVHGFILYKSSLRHYVHAHIGYNESNTRQYASVIVDATQ